jgi:hypothetical protein
MVLTVYDRLMSTVFQIILCSNCLYICLFILLYFIKYQIKSKGVIMTALLAKATALALAKHRVINSSCRDCNSFTYNNSINIAVVVAIDGGLITPVLQDADKVFDTLFRAASNRT